jgi:hypothetical protein
VVATAQTQANNMLWGPMAVCLVADKSFHKTTVPLRTVQGTGRLRNPASVIPFITNAQRDSLIPTHVSRELAVAMVAMECPCIPKPVN